ncbi:hypothetical protein [Amycolatopsis sp. H20-H5]|uniref:hypothetical protein n=1 Tax=Amycolatopsis sp. H20-H5 TaxID=3046309 RepID=UPI002DB93565|nr:hypothetical protein [Amycolatopsis sp. H20-H5]MEC3978999.1 hypothetical protein [Amycolatopsis sp. H20-H5]
MRTPASPWADERCRAVRGEALQYVANGWGVVPGSVWNGRRYTLGHCPSFVDGLVPVTLSGRTLRSAREVWSWWSVAPYGVLIRAEEDVAVLTAPRSLVVRALKRHHPAIRRCPVILGPFGARLLVSRQTPLRKELRDDLLVGMMPATSCVALPPTKVPAGSLSWLRDPSELGYRPGNADAVQIALVDAL